MNLKSKPLLDSLGKSILRELEANARISFSDLSRKVGLSSPAVIERVRKMEDAGIIKGYHAHVDLGTGQKKILAFIRMTTRPEYYPRVKRLLEKRPEILECHHVSGEESFMIKVLVPSVPDLEKIVETLSPLGQTRTSIVLSSPLIR